VTNAVQKFLNVKIHTLKPSLFIQNPEPLKDLIINYSELESINERE
jgi:hypothetical protein